MVREGEVSWGSISSHDFLKGRLITLINYSSSKEILLYRKERKTSEFVKLNQGMSVSGLSQILHT